MEKDDFLVLSAGTIPHANFIERVELAASEGFQGISIFPEQYLHARNKEGLSLKTMRKILETNHVSIVVLDPLMDWFRKPAASPSPSEEFFYKVVDSLEIQSINATAGFAPTSNIDELTESFGNLCHRASKYGVQIHLEFWPWAVVSNIKTAYKLVKNSGQANAGIMLDCWHFFRGGSQLSDLSEIDLKCITGIQLSDAPQVCGSRTFSEHFDCMKQLMLGGLHAIQVMGVFTYAKLASKAKSADENAFALIAETFTGRRLPGEGDLPLESLLSAIKKGGVTPPVEVEVFSTALRKLTSHHAAQKAMQSIRDLQASVGKLS